MPAFRGSRETWQSGLRTFGAVVYEELWPGVDLVFRGDRGRLKYSFVVAPGADPRCIRLAYHGANVSLKPGGANGKGDKHP